MSIRLRPIATALLLAILTGIFYGVAVGRQPIGPDEARVLSAAQQPMAGIAPLLIDTGDRWLPPIGFYATRLSHAIHAGFFAGRWASVMIAALNSGLIFLVAWRLFGGYIASITAAVVLVLMPAHIAYGRMGVDAIYVVPCALLWLYALLGFLSNDRPASIAGASTALGLGVYATKAGPLTMAFLFVAMIVVLWSAGRRKWSTLAIASASFAAMLVPLAVWFAFYPHTYLETYGSWTIHPAHIRNPYDLFLATINSNTLGTRASAYWGLVDPSYLFFSSTSGGAPLHWVTAPLILLGIYRAATRRSPASTMVLVAAAVAPLAGASFGQPHYIADALTLLPFAALLAGYGADLLRERISGPPPPASDEAP